MLIQEYNSNQAQYLKIVTKAHKEAFLSQPKLPKPQARFFEDPAPVEKAEKRSNSPYPGNPTRSIKLRIKKNSSTRDQKSERSTKDLNKMFEIMRPEKFSKSKLK